MLVGSADLFFSPLPLATSSPCCQLVFLELLRGRHAELPPAEYGDSFNCGEILAVVAAAASCGSFVWRVADFASLSEILGVFNLWSDPFAQRSQDNQGKVV